MCLKIDHIRVFTFVCCLFSCYGCTLSIFETGFWFTWIYVRMAVKVCGLFSQLFMICGLGSPHTRVSCGYNILWQSSYDGFPLWWLAVSLLNFLYEHTSVLFNFQMPIPEFLIKCNMLTAIDSSDLETSRQQSYQLSEE